MTPTVNQWTRTAGDIVIHSDTDDHVALLLRTLQIDEAAWRDTLDAWATHWTADCADPAIRLDRLRAAFELHSPHQAPLPTDPSTNDCPICGRSPLDPTLARRSHLSAPTDHKSEPLILYARCRACGHGALVRGAPAETPYTDADYYTTRDRGGTGYDDYAQESAYRIEYTAWDRPLVIREPE